MSSDSGSFKNLSTKTLSVSKVYGVEQMFNKEGKDILSSFTGAAKETKEKDDTLLKTLLLRLDKLEQLVANIKPAEKGEKGDTGPEGPAGIDGRNGISGAQGPAGKRGTVEKMQDIGDVNLDGLKDGSILQFSGGKWICVELEYST